MIDDVSNPFNEGDWLVWTTEFTAKRGQVVQSVGPSIEVEWLGGERQVFPIVEGYVSGAYRGVSARMERIERPKEATRIARERKRGVISITGAAASLGTTPKRVRALLRSGQLKGHQIDGKWVSVELEA